MRIKRFEIKNRQGLKLVIQVDTPENPTNLVFIACGQGGFIEQEHIQAFTNVYLENSYRVVRFDPTNSIGESGGDIQNVTYTGYVEDLEDVINWARAQSWFKQTFVLCGHSMGGFSTTYYAENHPDEVESLAPLATVINYELLTQSYDPDYLENWEKRGYKEEKSRSKPGVVKKIGWGVMEDLKKYNLLERANKLSMPVLFMSGELDTGTPYEHQMKLFEAIPHNNKKIIKILGVEHSFQGPNGYDEKLDEVKNEISNWLKTSTRSK